MNKALFISRDFSNKKGGANQVAKRNLFLLSKLFSIVDTIEVPLPSTRTRLKNLLLWETYGENRKTKEELKTKLKNSNYDIVFFDGSYYGSLVKICAQANVKTVVFFHNVEFIYYKEKYRSSKRVVDYIMSYFIKHSESISIKYATEILPISARDKAVLSEIYQREVKYVLPTSFEPINESLLTNLEPSEKPYLLFVGTKFFANSEALKFILSKIAPYIDLDIWIVGDVCETISEKNTPQNVKLVGVVDSLDRYYIQSIGVIAPIFSGSGLKTKSVEALKYGKTLLGTTEAFEGIPILEFPSIGKVCNTAKEFIDAINTLEFKKINKDSLSLFYRDYSHTSQLNNFKQIIKDILET